MSPRAWGGRQVPHAWPPHALTQVGEGPAPGAQRLGLAAGEGRGPISPLAHSSSCSFLNPSQQPQGVVTRRRPRVRACVRVCTCMRVCGTKCVTEGGCHRGMACGGGGLFATCLGWPEGAWHAEACELPWPPVHGQAAELGLQLGAPHLQGRSGARPAEALNRPPLDHGRVAVTFGFVCSSLKCDTLKKAQLRDSDEIGVGVTRGHRGFLGQRNCSV